MLENIILLKWKKYEKEKQGSHYKPTTFMAYPDEKDIFDKDELLNLVLQTQKTFLEKEREYKEFDRETLSVHAKAIHYGDYNLLILPLPYRYFLIVVFDKDTNPYDYRNELIKHLFNYFMPRYHSLKKEVQKTNLLLTLFVDLRQYDEMLQAENTQNITIINNVPMIKVFVYGLDNAGKSSLMRLLSTGKFDFDYFPPTKKFRITNIKLKTGVKLIFWDMPGQRIFRKDWLRGAQATNIVLFVLDIADKQRYEEAKEELWNMLALYELHGLPLVFLANKIDLLEELPSKDTLIKYFELEKCTDRNWTLIFSSLPYKKGIDSLLNWFTEQTEELLLINGIEIPSSLTKI